MIIVAILLCPVAAEAQRATCQFRGAADALSERPSPLDSLMIPLGDAVAMLCYGRPSSEAASRVGSEFPFGSPWEMGANEPTTLHLPFAASLGGVDLTPGSYSLYAIPDREAWTVVVNGNPNRWGVPISAEVRAADLGGVEVAPAVLPDPVETLTFRFDATGERSGSLVYEWERTRLAIPISRR